MFVRLALKVVIRNDVDFVDALLLHLSSHQHNFDNAGLIS